VLDVERVHDHLAEGAVIVVGGVRLRVAADLEVVALPDLVEGLPDKTAKLQGMPEYDSAYLIVNTLSGQPGIMVYVQQSGRLSRWSIYDLDGKVIGGTPE